MKRISTCLMIVTFLSLLGAVPARAQIGLGATAPNFTKTDLTGTPRSLSDYITGNPTTSKVVVLFLLGYD